MTPEIETLARIIHKQSKQEPPLIDEIRRNAETLIQLIEEEKKYAAPIRGLV